MIKTFPKLLFFLIITFYANSLFAVNGMLNINNDNKIGLEEVILLMKVISQVDNNSISDSNVFDKMINSIFFSISDSIDSIGKEELVSRLNENGFADIEQKHSLIDIAQKYLSPQFPCGNIIKNNNSEVIFSFTGKSECKGMTGNVIVEPLLTETQANYKCLLNNFITKNNCTNNGKVVLSLTFQKTEINLLCNFENFSSCDRQYTGTININYNTDSNIASIKSQSFNFSTEDISGTVDFDIDYNVETKIINGDAKIQSNETGSLNFLLKGIKIDRYCKLQLSNQKALYPLPVAGELVINGITADFDNTTCTSQNVMIKTGSFTFTISIAKLYELIIDKNNSLNANAKVKFKGVNFDCELNNVQLDTSCGIFTNGDTDVSKTFEQCINLGFKEYCYEKEVTIGLDFSNTNCDNQKVKFNLPFGISKTVNWDTIMDFEIPNPFD